MSSFSDRLNVVNLGEQLNILKNNFEQIHYIAR